MGRRGHRPVPGCGRCRGTRRWRRPRPRRLDRRSRPRRSVGRPCGWSNRPPRLAAQASPRTPGQWSSPSSTSVGATSVASVSACRRARVRHQSVARPGAALRPGRCAPPGRSPPGYATPGADPSSPTPPAAEPAPGHRLDSGLGPPPAPAHDAPGVRHVRAQALWDLNASTERHAYQPLKTGREIHTARCPALRPRTDRTRRTSGKQDAHRVRGGLFRKLRRAPLADGGPGATVDTSATLRRGAWLLPRREPGCCFTDGLAPIRERITRRLPEGVASFVYDAFKGSSS